MSLRFFADHCVPTEITKYLRSAGYDVQLLREALPISSPDPEVIAQAQSGDQILLTLNGDFSDIVTYPPAAYGGIVAIQLHNHPEVIPQLLKNLSQFLASQPEPGYYRGKLLIVEAHRIRVRI